MLVAETLRAINHPTPADGKIRPFGLCSFFVQRTVTEDPRRRDAPTVSVSYDALATAALLDPGCAAAALIRSTQVGKHLLETFRRLLRGVVDQCDEGSSGTAAGAAGIASPPVTALTTATRLTACAVLCLPAAGKPYPNVDTGYFSVILAGSALRDLAQEMLLNPAVGAPIPGGVGYTLEQAATQLAGALQAAAAQGAASGAGAAPSATPAPAKRRRLSRDERAREFRSGRQLVEIRVAGETEPVFLHVRESSRHTAPPLRCACSSCFGVVVRPGSCSDTRPSILRPCSVRSGSSGAGGSAKGAGSGGFSSQTTATAAHSPTPSTSAPSSAAARPPLRLKEPPR